MVWGANLWANDLSINFKILYTGFDFNLDTTLWNVAERCSMNDLSTKSTEMCVSLISPLESVSFAIRLQAVDRCAKLNEILSQKLM